MNATPNSKRPAPSERSARRLIAAGATATLLGIVLSVAASRGLSAWVTLAALLLLLLGLHRFGRTGPDAPQPLPRASRAPRAETGVAAPSARQPPAD